MKRRKSGKTLLLLLMMLPFTLICSYAQERLAQDCKLLEPLPNNEAIVECNGVKLRGITPAHAREIEDRKVRLETADRKIELLEQKIAELERAISLHEQLNTA